MIPLTQFNYLDVFSFAVMAYVLSCLTFLLEHLFCQHTHLTLPLKTMDHSPNLPYLQQSESDLQGSLEYLLQMDTTLPFHLSFVCQGSLENTKHIVSCVSKAFHVCP